MEEVIFKKIDPLSPLETGYYTKKRSGYVEIYFMYKGHLIDEYIHLENNIYYINLGHEVYKCVNREDAFQILFLLSKVSYDWGHER